MRPNPFSSLSSDFKKFTRRARARIPSPPKLGVARTAAWSGVGLLLFAFVYLAQSSNAALIARNLRVKQLQLEELQRENSELRYEIAAATSPGSIEARARALGLGPAKRVIYAELPTLKVDQAEVMPSFMPIEPPPPPVAASPSAWDQFLALFGLGGASDRVQAETK